MCDRMQIYNINQTRFPRIPSYATYSPLMIYIWWLASIASRASSIDECSCKLLMMVVWLKHVVQRQRRICCVRQYPGKPGLNCFDSYTSTDLVETYFCNICDWIKKFKFVNILMLCRCCDFACWCPTWTTVCCSPTDRVWPISSVPV
jgi:hypothetical protein